MTNELRRRTKIKELNNAHTQMSNKKHRSKQGFSIQTSLLCLILSSIILTIFGIFYMDTIPWHIGATVIDKVAVNFGYIHHVYAVVIDAGSTGSRVYAFTFHDSYIGSSLMLDKEEFDYNKVGLSAFAENPESGAKTIAKLLEKAKKHIPEKHWDNTTLLMKATAGLRLLPPDKADKLLWSVRNILEDEPFLKRSDSVEIMNGVDEGIYSWFTVNFLLDRINGNPVDTVAALDLGGGSTQVTFAAFAPSSLRHKKRIHMASSPRGNIPVYTQSFLGLGLTAARKEILTHGQTKSKNLTSECVNHIITGHKFKYNHEIYYVSGPKDEYLTMQSQSNEFRPAQEIPIVNMDKCMSIINNFVKKNSKPPEELTNKIIFAFSFYFDRAAEADLIDPIKGGKIKLQDFKDAAIGACRTPNSDQPFMCLDLAFIWILLENGLGLKLDTTIHLFKKINGHEISWALGAAYNALKNGNS